MMHKYRVTMRQTNGYNPPLKTIEINADSHEHAKSIAESRFGLTVLSTQLID